MVVLELSSLSLAKGPPRQGYVTLNTLSTREHPGPLNMRRTSSQGPSFCLPSSLIEVLVHKSSTQPLMPRTYVCEIPYTQYTHTSAKYLYSVHITHLEACTKQFNHHGMALGLLFPTSQDLITASGAQVWNCTKSWIPSSKITCYASGGATREADR